MIKAALIVCFVAVSLAAPAPEEIISYDAVDHKHEQQGKAGVAVKGSYSYTDADGKVFTINYVADDNGYRAEGAHLPIAPEVSAVAEPVAEPAAEPSAEKPAEPAVEAPVADAKAAETPASTATFVPAPVIRTYLASPYGAYPYAAPYYPSSPYGFIYGYSTHGSFPFYG